MRTKYVGATLLLVFLLSYQLQAQELKKSTFHLAPKETIALLQVPRVSLVIEKALGYVEKLELHRFDEVKEFLESTPFQRFTHLLKYLEKVYHRPWAQLLSDLTHEGITVALVPVPAVKDPQILTVVEGRDADLLQKVFQALLALVKEEASHSVTPLSVRQKEHRQVQVYSLGDKLFLAQHQTYFLAATHSSLITQTIEQLVDSQGSSIQSHPRFVSAEIPSSPGLVAWGWLDLDFLKTTQAESLEQFKLPTNDLIPQLLFGGLADAVFRSSHVWLSVQLDEQGPRLELSSPAGRSMAQEGARLLHMHDPAQGGTLPLLFPQGTLYSTSFYWNLGDAWKQREKLFQEGAIKDFEEGDKAVRPFLAGNSLSRLFELLGARHRFVATRQRSTGYSIKAKSTLPGMGLVLECREAEQFEKLLNLPLRGAGLLFYAAVQLRYFEEQHEGHKITGYRFAEVEKNKAYQQGYYFNFSPCFVRVGKYFVLSSTQELCRDLVTELKKEPEQPVYEPADMRQQFSWSALGTALAAERPLVITELTLRHGGSPERIEEQMNQLLHLLHKLGTVELNIHHSPAFKLEMVTNYSR